MMRWTRRFFAAAIAASAIFAPGVWTLQVWAAEDGMTYKGAPSLSALVEENALPPVEERLPRTPLVVDLDARGQYSGHHGGELRMLMSRAKDTRQLYVYSYARLVKYDPELELVPDIVADFDVEAGRVFTFHLREGHKWSDGHPFTSEDFRYWWKYVANNEDLYPIGPPAFLKVDDEYPTVTFPDARTVVYSWSKPNPNFLPALARANPEVIYLPKHYMQQFHPEFADEVRLEAEAEEAGQRSWASVHTKKARLYRMTNPDLPNLQPWYPTVAPPNNRFIFERNPYYHKVDSKGHQLPYIDRIIFDISESSLIPGKAATGDVDLQGRYLTFDDITLLKRNEAKHGYSTYLWRIAKGAHMALYPNMTHADPRWRNLVRDTRFRRALSLAINRHEINRVIYFGLALEGQNTVLPESPLYRPEYRERYTEFDLAQANALLDEIGLERRFIDGQRVYPNGDPVDIIVETTGSEEEADILQLIKDTWWKVGIRVFIKPLSKDNLRRRVFSGQTQMTIASGLENGLATAGMVPDELAPVHQIQYQWSDWGQWFETNANNGTPPDTAKGKRLVHLLDRWYGAGSVGERRVIWHEMLNMHSQNLFTIGLIAGVLQPIVVRDGLRNVPEKGLWNWDPGAHFGLYGLDTFWWDDTVQTARAGNGLSGNAGGAD